MVQRMEEERSLVLVKQPGSSARASRETATCSLPASCPAFRRTRGVHADVGTTLLYRAAPRRAPALASPSFVLFFFFSAVAAVTHDASPFSLTHTRSARTRSAASARRRRKDDDEKQRGLRHTRVEILLLFSSSFFLPFLSRCSSRERLTHAALEATRKRARIPMEIAARCGPTRRGEREHSACRALKCSCGCGESSAHAHTRAQTHRAGRVLKGKGAHGKRERARERAGKGGAGRAGAQAKWREKTRFSAVF